MDSPTVTSVTTDTMNYALQVALQTMKERCVQLQRRLCTMEEEQQKLRDQLDNKTIGTTQTNASVNGAANDNYQLRQQVNELQRQKAQLTEQINMVSTENRKLWSRLSQISKEQNHFNSSNKDITHEVEQSSSSAVIGASQNLIRSKTFTQHSPNPHLRQKLISDDLKDLSLKEISLCDTDISAGETFGTHANDAELGFPYIHVDEYTEKTESDFNADAKRCMEGLLELRREAMKQQQELNSCLTAVEARIALQPCAECAKKTKKPEMADKSLETDESLSELKQYNENTDKKSTNKIATPDQNKINQGDIITTPVTTRINILQEKINADAMLKRCPMCGIIYDGEMSFDLFQNHVEAHFIDDSLDIESSIERNFEFVSHAVGNF